MSRAVYLWNPDVGNNMKQLLFYALLLSFPEVLSAHSWKLNCGLCGPCFDQHGSSYGLLIFFVWSHFIAESIIVIKEIFTGRALERSGIYDLKHGRKKDKEKIASQFILQRNNRWKLILSFVFCKHQDYFLIRRMSLNSATEEKNSWSLLHPIYPGFWILNICLCMCMIIR